MKHQFQHLKIGSYTQEIARGNVRHAYSIMSYGQVDTGTSVTDLPVRSCNGGDIKVPQSVQMSINSTSSDDSAAGTGVRSVVLEYLNGDLDLSYEVIVLNGTTPVTTLATDIRWIQGLHGATFGSNGKAVGDISVTNGADTYAQILSNERTCKTSFRRTPRDKTILVNSIFASSNSGTWAARSTVQLVTSKIDGLDQSETGLLYPRAGVALQDSSTTLSLDMPLAITSGHIVGFVATTNRNSTVGAGFIGWVE